MTGKITHVVAVLDELVAIAKAAYDGVEGFEVLDGPKLGWLAYSHLAIGVTDSDETAPYTTRYTRQDGYGVPRYVESFEIRCSLCVASGSNDLAGVRRQAELLLGHLDDMLRPVARKPGVWEQIGMGESDMQWYPVPNEEGSTVLVYFSIEGESLL